jgi:tetratricopeptide (TPR) repeat protein
MSARVDRPFAGEQVALAGRLSVFSRRDVRALVERLGGVFRAEITADTTLVIAGLDAPELPAGAGVPRVLTEADLCVQAGLPDLDALKSRYRSARDVRGLYPIIRDDHLRYLERCGLVRSVAGRYSFADLSLIKQVAGGLDRGASLNALMRSLLAERTGQLALDFQTSARADRAPARVVTLPAPAAGPEATRLSGTRAEQVATANRTLAAKCFLDGAALDDGENRDLDAASAAYRRAALFDPLLVPALVNLANIHYERDELVEAEALYEKAIRVDPECFEAYFNLGNIHHDLARYADALVSYREALQINASYPEAHFYLAVTLEKLGRSSEARPHWREYRSLAPDGEFVELAKEFSD